MKSFNLLTAWVFAVLLTFTSTSAKAAGSVNGCIDTTESTYDCMITYGYRGVDPYGYYKFSNPTKDPRYPHNCTSLAAYMLYLYNSYDVNISANQVFIRDTVTNELNPEWPDHFITFPKDPSGGGKGPIALSTVGPTQ